MTTKLRQNSPLITVSNFITQLRERHEQRLTIILGLSGGPDSVFLLHALVPLHKRGTIHLVAAHINHGWRDEAGADEQFCKELCAMLNVPFHVAHARDFAGIVKKNGSQEEYGRNLRRAFFEKLLNTLNADYIALGHHKQDVEENFFIRLIRGSTLTGLVGMKQVDGVYMRPLLHISKDELVAYLDENKLEYCTDESNTSQSFLRNRLRTTVLPALHATDKRFSDKFHDTLSHMYNSETYLQRLTTQAFEAVFSCEKTASHRGNLKELLKLDPFLAKRVLVSWLTRSGKSFTLSSRYLDEIIRFLDSPRGGTHQIGTDVIIKKLRGQFWIS